MVKKIQKCSSKHGFTIMLVLLFIAAFFLVSSFMKESAIQKNTEIAVQIVEQGMETGDIDDLADQYFDPNIVLEFPPDFQFPPTNEHIIIGAENIKEAIHAWKIDTMHQVDVIDTIADEDSVVVFISVDRIFNTDEDASTPEHTHEDHPMIYVFSFENGKITKMVDIFDVLEHVEDFKTEKYQ